MSEIINSPVEDNTDYYGHERMESQESDENFTDKNSVEDSSSSKNTVMAFVCKLKPKQGPLNLEKCVEKGVPPGPLLGQLKNGIDITLPNGNIVKASDVITPGDPGPVFIGIY